MALFGMQPQIHDDLNCLDSMDLLMKTSGRKCMEKSTLYRHRRIIFNRRFSKVTLEMDWHFKQYGRSV